MKTDTPDSIPLNVGVKPEDGRIDADDIGPYTHTVKWVENNGEPSSIRYCNNCGSSFSLTGIHEGRKILICAECRVFQGFM